MDSIGGCIDERPGLYDSSTRYLIWLVTFSQIYFLDPCLTLRKVLHAVNFERQCGVITASRHIKAIL
eukprot:6483615-Amphidinium_carterae.2